jgi:hypothetical protein
VRRQLDEQRAAGIAIGPNEERDRVTERVAALRGSLNQRQYDALRNRVFVNPPHDTGNDVGGTHDNWNILRSSDPNVIALWITTLRDGLRVWVTGYGPISYTAFSESPTAEDDAGKGWLTLGTAREAIAVSQDARRPAWLAATLDPAQQGSLSAIEDYALRWEARPPGTRDYLRPGWRERARKAERRAQRQSQRRPGNPYH